MSPERCLRTPTAGRQAAEGGLQAAEAGLQAAEGGRFAAVLRSMRSSLVRRAFLLNNSVADRRQVM